MFRSLLSYKVIPVLIGSLAAISVFFTANAAIHTDKGAYWRSSQRKGANIFNQGLVGEDILKSAKQAGLQFIRLAPDKWKGKGRDFLIGNADDYRGLVTEDLAYLRSTLSKAEKQGIKVVITMLSLPGARWRQHNNGRDDTRLWRLAKYQDQAVKFWEDLAQALRGNKAVVGYNIINEPRPEVVKGYRDFTLQSSSKYAQEVKGTLANLSQFYQKVVNAVRGIDSETPIILDVGLCADPRAFTHFQPVGGKHILYSFHMYEPYDYTNKRINSGRYSYPGRIPIGAGGSIYVDKAKLKELYLNPVIAWKKKYNVPTSSIMAGEFGAHRTTKGVTRYFKDLIDLFNEQGWHWAFYAFREDSWDGMDYELGTKPLPWTHWANIEKGKKPNLPRQSNEVWQVILKALQK